MQFGIHFGKAKGHSKAMVNFTKYLLYNFKRYTPKQFFYQQIFYLNQSMASGQPPKIVQRHMAHPVNVCFTKAFKIVSR